MPIASNYDYTSNKIVEKQEAAYQSAPATGKSWRDNTQSEASSQMVANGQDGNRLEEATSWMLDHISPSESRRELIERIKRNQRPQQWLTETHDYPRSPRLPICKTEPRSESCIANLDAPLARTLAPIQPDNFDSSQVELASSIERPRSALHRGDFHGNESNGLSSYSPGSPIPRENAWLGTSPPPPWLSRRVELPPLKHGLHSPVETLKRHDSVALPSRSRALSHSNRSKFIFRAPTSPLANQSNTEDFDAYDDFSSEALATNPEKASRRHTFSPSSTQDARVSAIDAFAFGSPTSLFSSWHRAESFPYQAHQPRRSLASLDDSSNSIWATSAHTRRPSLSSETSPLQRAPMIGRYEESILRGRMSSLPSRPLDFIAQIGVLGKGNCKSSLRCPPHIQVPFPAIFYQYGGLPGAIVNDGPSPYVGMVELGKNAPSQDTFRTSHRSCIQRNKSQDSGEHDSADWGKNNDGLSTAEKTRGNDGRPHSAPTGGYRIPEQGQIQVIIRNPNKTAVKLFLVPYDLTGMEPGHKTFVRQRSYSAGPILNMALETKVNPISDKGVATSMAFEKSKDRPVLRYLIHMHICCTGRNRYYLYKNIRVVFANRVPDGKERLQQEIQLPEPRFSPYKPDTYESSNKRQRCVPLPRKHFDFEPPLTDVSAQDYTVPSSSECRATSQKGLARKMDTQKQNAAYMHSLPTHLPVLPPIDSSTPVASNINVQEHANDPCYAMTSPFHRSFDSAKPSTFSSALFERLDREKWTPSGAPPRTQSPQPGEGLIAQQHRVWTSRNGSPEF